MRDHTKLRAFELADQLAVAIYKTTRSFPREKMFGLTSQLRRAAVSIASNIVEGSTRFSEGISALSGYRLWFCLRSGISDRTSLTPGVSGGTFVSGTGRIIPGDLQSPERLVALLAQEVTRLQPPASSL